jgi:tRNA(Ile)-lysidine synthase
MKMRFDPVGTLLELSEPRPRVVLAFSGGLDSTVLAHSLMKRRRALGHLRLVHVDHGLQVSSREWSRHCATLAEKWNVPFTALRARVAPRRGESVEAVARAARYRLLADDLAAGETLVTAQHRDDQVETLLLQLFRGAGVAGLAAMPRVAEFAGGRIVRPLLSHSRADLQRYAARHRLRWIEDPSNRLERFDRNYLRLRVLPMMRERWSGIDEAIARSARHMGEAARIVDAAAQRDLLNAMDGAGLNVAVLRRLTPAARRNLLRAFIARAGLELPSTAKMAEMSGPLLAARRDAQPEVAWTAGRLRRRGPRLELEVKSEDAVHSLGESFPESWNWREQRELLLNGAEGRFVLLDDEAGNIDLARLPRVLHVRRRRGGELLRPGPRARMQSLKKLMQAAKLTVEERARMPLLFSRGRGAERLIAAGDRWIDVSVQANVKSPRRARLVWRRGTGAG